MIFFKIVFVCKAIQARLLKNVNKHFRNFVSQNQQKTIIEKWDEKLTCLLDKKDMDERALRNKSKNFLLKIWWIRNMNTILVVNRIGLHK